MWRTVPAYRVITSISPELWNFFKNAKDLESFERSLNDPNKHVNNLDLNADDNVDYVRVVDLVDGTTHAVTLQVVIGPKDAQDIAVIGVEKTGDGQAVARIMGDEALYGRTRSAEPIEEDPEEGGWRTVSG
ncbi:MAG: hypothetical protein IPK99_12265 [Flavobacteriales bacterium]|nr:hypothetical protein [Flavobacteriales bacterium]